MYILLKSITQKKVLFSAIGMLVACVVNAQQLFGPRSDYYMNDNFLIPSIGFEAGGNLSNEVGYTNSYFKSNSLAGFHAGFTFSLPLTYPLSFAPEVLFAQTGYSAGTTFGDFTQKASYIDLPLLAKFNVGPVLNLYIGPQFSFLLFKKNNYHTGFITSSEYYYDKSNSRETYFCGVLGASANITQVIDLHLRYTIDLEQTGANGNFYLPGYRNQVWQMGLGFKF